MTMAIDLTIPCPVHGPRKWWGAQLRQYAIAEAENSIALHEEFQKAMEENDPIAIALSKQGAIEEAPTFRNIGLFKPLQVPVGTVSTLIHRAKRSLRASMPKYFMP